VGALQDLDRLLAKAVSDPQGYEEVEKYNAYPLLQQLTDDDWFQLRSLWKHRPAEWQRVLAKLLEDGPPKQTVPIFVDMLESMNIDLMEAVLDVLPPELTDISLSEQVIARLLRPSVRFNRNAFLENPNLPRLLKAVGHPIQKG
jgi:hypothetical protein